MPADVRIHVLGPLRVTIDGEDRSDRLSEPQRIILAALAGADGPVERQRLRSAAGLAASSMDAELSRIRSRLGSDRHLHRSRTPSAGWLTLASDVWVDVDEVERLLDRAFERGPTITSDLARVEGLWRGPPLARLVEVEPAPGSHPPLVGAVRRRAWSLRRRHIELSTAILTSPGVLDPDRTARWVQDHPTHVPARLAHLEVLARRVGASAADRALEAWIREGAPVEASRRGREVVRRVAEERPPLDTIGSVVDAARRGLDRLEHRTVADVLEPLRSATEGMDRWRVLLTRADAMRLGARWDDAEAEFRAALAEAEVLGDPDAAAETLLAVARIVWQPGPLAELVESGARRLMDDVADRGIAAELAAVRAGGLYQSGELAPGLPELARCALDDLSAVRDPHRRAEALLRCRKALLGVDPPDVQLQRSAEIVELAGTRVDLRSAGLLASVVDHLHAADVERARRAATAHAALARDDPTGIVGFHQANLDTVFALADGRFDDARDCVERASEVGEHLGPATVDQLVFAQRFWIAHAHHDGDAMALFADLLAPTDGDRHPVWDAARAVALADAGDVDQARVAIVDLAERTDRFATVPAGPHRVPTLAMLIVAATARGRVTRGDGRFALPSDGTDVRELLASTLTGEPLAGALIGWPTVYVGPIDELVAAMG